MSPFSLARRSLTHHWRTNVAVGLGVMVATAVLTGAMVVGDSMYMSLLRLALDRLGRIDSALVVPRFFREKLVEEVVAAPEFKRDFTDAVPGILLTGTLENPNGEHHYRAGGATVLGITPEFWKLGDGKPSQTPAGDEIVLNQPVADQLHAKAGDEVVLRLPQATDVPADSPLGRKTETVRSHRFTVSQIIPAEGLGGFSLRPSQRIPLDAFAPLATLQQMVGAEGKANLILVAAREGADRHDADRDSILKSALKPTLSDYGLSLRKTNRGYFNLTTDRMMLEPGIEAAALKAFAQDHAQPVFTYLANYVTAADGRGKIPYSTVAAVDSTDQQPLGPLLNRQGQPIPALADDEIVLNSWAADDLAAQGAPVKPGDTIEITYFEPESTHGKVEETSHKFRLKDIAELAGPADDRDFTPQVKGVTDESSIANWSPPFPYFPERVRTTPPSNQDDRYWQQYRATPKAFVSLTEGRKLWGSRFGDTTSIRIPPGEDISEESLTNRLEQAIDPASMGFSFLPIRRQALTAAEGTTPFALLFLGFSMFIIAAALMLVMLLFRLGVETRATELGIELAVGLRRSLARRIMLIEGGLVAVLGALAGAAAGVGYAWLMLEGLKTWWLGAISTPFLHLYIDEHSVIHGFFIGVLVSLATIVWALRQTRHSSIRQLLSGQIQPANPTSRRRARWAPWLAVASILAAIAAGLSATSLKDESQSLMFLGSGALVLTGILAWIWSTLRTERRSSPTRGSLLHLALRSAARNPLRSTLTIGLTATASFLIIALSAFQLDAPKRGPTLDSGDGGFALVAQSDQPIYQDLNAADARRELGFGGQSEKLLAAAEQVPHPTDHPKPANSDQRAEIYSLRVQAGDDASCLNLYQPRQPRILGVSDRFLNRGGFSWGAILATTEAERKNPWLLLSRARQQADSAVAPDQPIPVVLDQNTAMYSLHLGEGAGQTFQIDRPGGGKITLQVVGVLINSIFQGDLLISQSDFLQLLPESSGYRYFLVTAPPHDVPDVAEALESALGDYGFTTQATSARMAEFFAVQNTYLAAFRSLGGLGLLLGTLGLAAAQLRSIVERRGELALFQAIGFRRRRLGQMVLLESTVLLLAGLAVGAISALVTLIPHLLVGGAAVPWTALAVTLAIVLIAGLLAGTFAVRAVLRAPLLPALRGN